MLVRASPTLAMLPDWRIHDSDELFRAEYHAAASTRRGHTERTIVEYRNDKPVARVAQVTSMYKFVPPRTWLENIMGSVNKKMVGDISLLELQVTNNAVLAILKLPMQFSRAECDEDTFGLTMVAHNTYSGSKSMKLGLGAIRAACANGCVWGDHSALQLAHRGTEGSEAALDTYLHPLIDRGATHARGYLSRMTEKSLTVPVPSMDPASAGPRADEYAARKALHDCSDDVTFAILSMDLLWTQKVRLCQHVLAERYLAGSETRVSMYDFYNFCTNVASHQLPKARDELKARTAMLHAINAAFDAGGLVLRLADGAYGAERREKERAQMREDGWAKGWWWSFDPTTPYGPLGRAASRKAAKRARRVRE